MIPRSPPLLGDYEMLHADSFIGSSSGRHFVALMPTNRWLGAEEAARAEAATGAIPAEFSPDGR